MFAFVWPWSLNNTKKGSCSGITSLHCKYIMYVVGFIPLRGVWQECKPCAYMRIGSMQCNEITECTFGWNPKGLLHLGMVYVATIPNLSCGIRSTSKFTFYANEVCWAMDMVNKFVQATKIERSYRDSTNVTAYCPDLFPCPNVEEFWPCISGFNRLQQNVFM